MTTPRVPHVLLLGGFSFLVARLPGLPVRVTCLRDEPYDEDLVLRCGPRVVRADQRDEQSIRAVARAVHAADPLDAVVTYDDATMPVAARIAEELGVGAAGSGEARRATTDKARMREVLHAAGIDATPYKMCASAADLAAFVAEVGPAVAKPAAGAAGRRVTAVDAPDGAASAWERLTAGGPPPGGVLAEQRLPGQEYSVETLTVGGRHRVAGIVTKTTSGPPFFIELGHAVGGGLPAGVADRITAAVTAALDALGVTCGPCHTEVMVDGDDVRAIELNPRVAGGQIWEIVELATGVDMFAAYLLTAAGLDAPPAYRDGAAAARLFAASEAGVAWAVHGAEEARTMEGVVRIGLPNLPRLVRPPESGDDRLGFVVAVGATRGEATERAAAAAARIDVEVRSA